jgi:hypothetical protein
MSRLRGSTASRIRRVRAETRKTNVLSEKEAADVFDKKINEKIEAAIEAKVNELVKNDEKPGRPNSVPILNGL